MYQPCLFWSFILFYSSTCKIVLISVYDLHMDDTEHTLKDHAEVYESNNNNNNNDKKCSIVADAPGALDCHHWFDDKSILFIISSYIHDSIHDTSMHDDHRHTVYDCVLLLHWIQIRYHVGYI